ncbi:PREDICTED: uncharacterized protein LOC107187635 [Dufourea novaeangliae]|uniref:uncharacterized protein LOC107187635 n=1 Tax=Dufourea novaeangliae TaxID=178035 RepID=UPI000767C8CC|nr:PREDICTED: uncharacterized protein LOC107187635 [Dufourea novaeangliae]
MKTSSFRSLSVGLFLLLSVSSLQSDPQQSYLINYPTHPLINPRIQPLEVVQDQYSVPSIQRPVKYSTEYVSKSFPAYEPNYFRSDTSWYPASVPETKYRQDNRYYEYQNFASSNQETKENRDTRQDSFRQEEDSESVLKEKEITRNMNILDKLLSEDSNEKDLENNGLEEKILSEETKRVARQIRKQRPGFFWTLARVTFEAFNDTKSAFQQISEIINNGIAPDSATQSSMPRGSLTVIGATSPPRDMTAVNETETTTMLPATTTEAPPFVLTRGSLQTLIRRNVLGLVRLFNIEWRDALNQSEVNVREFRKDLGNQVGTFLQDNPNAY